MHFSQPHRWSKIWQGIRIRISNFCLSLYEGAWVDVIVLLSTIRSFFFLVVQIRLFEILPVLIPLITTSTTTIYNTSTREYQYSLNCTSTINLKNQSKVNFWKFLKCFDASQLLKKLKNSRQARSWTEYIKVFYCQFYCVCVSTIIIQILSVVAFS